MNIKVLVIIIFAILFSGCEKKMCPEDYTNKDGKCVAITEKEPEIEKYCEEEYTLINGECIKEIISEANISYSCEIGYELNKTICEKRDLKYMKRFFTCPENYKLSESLCIPTAGNNVRCAFNPNTYTIECHTIFFIEADPAYEACPEGYINKTNSICEKIETKAANSKYYCPKNQELRNDKCVTNEVVTASVNYICEPGYIFNQERNLCLKEN